MDRTVNLKLHFNDLSEVNYEWGGKFQAPSPEWIHMSRVLGNYELMVVTDGILYIADEKKRYAAGEGEYVLMAPVPRQYGYRPSDCSFYWLHFTVMPAAGAQMPQREGEEPSGTCAEIPAYGKLPSPGRVVILMKQLQDSDRRYHDKRLNDSLTAAILSEIICQGQKGQGQRQDSPDSQLFNDVADYIRYFIGQPLKISDIADNFGYSGKYLTVLCRKHTGMGLKQYILQLKMEHAMAALTDTNRTVADIAYEAGFDDPGNFTNAFKKIAGMSPSQYRDSFGKRSLFYR